MKTYIWNLLEVLSQLGHALFLGGNPNITISARCYLERRRPGWRCAYKRINRLFFLQKDRCRDSWVSDVQFARRALFELEVPRSKPTGPIRHDTF